MKRLDLSSILTVFIWIAIVILQAFSCTPKFSKGNEILCNYKSRHINEIIQKWGDPIKSFVGADGNKVYVYYYADIKRSKTMNQASSFGGPVGTAAESYIERVDYCTAFFEVNSEGTITRCGFEGTVCE